MVHLALVSVATVAFLLFAGAHAQRSGTQDQPIQNVVDALESYYRARLRGESGGNQTPRRGQWDWEWDQTGEREAEIETGAREIDATEGGSFERIRGMIEDLQLRLFMDDVKDTSRSYQDLCPRLMDLLGRGFMRNWLAGYMHTLRGDHEFEGRGERTERQTEWNAELSRILRGRTTTSDVREGREGRVDRESRTGVTMDPTSSMWQGLMASCYVYTDVMSGTAPRLESTRWERTGQQ